MPATHVKDLHVANSINELNKKYEVDLSKRQLSAVTLSKSAQKLFEMAEKSRIDGDEEIAYIYFMKYLGIVNQIKDTADYPNNKKAVMERVLPKNVNLALNYAESMKKSLEKRYDDKKRLKEHENQTLLKKKIEADIERARKNMEHSSPKIANLPIQDDKTIKARQLYTKIQSKEKIIILDTRPSEDFKKSHMFYPYCISVPQEKIIKGLTPDRIIRNLPHDTINVWNKRENMDIIVLLDWTSTELVPDTNLAILHTALIKWDIEVNKHKYKPIILEGGYETWVLSYPTMTTNPHVTPPESSNSLDDLLEDIDYPTLIDTPTEKKPSALPNGPSSSTILVNKEVKPVTHAPSANPVIDRSKKPAALEMYERRSKEMKMLLEQKEKLANDSFTIEKERIEAEENWEKIHTSHEKEAEEGEKESLQLKKDELHSYLLLLESKQCDTTLEIDQIKKQLAILEAENKEMMEDSTVASPTDESANVVDSDVVIPNEEDAKKVMEETLEKERNIKEIEEKRAELVEKREHLQMERERKLAIARAQKRLITNMKQMEESQNDFVPLKTDENTTGFKRSHSSPNIAQMVDEEKSTRAKVPNFDRNVKPIYKTVAPIDYNQTRFRDFGEALGSLGKGLTGLKNLGNTCYMNSIMQCLSNTAVLAVYFCRDNYRDDVRGAQVNSKGNNGTRGAVAEEVAALVKALWSGQFRFISAKDLRNVVGKHQVMFRGFEQQDSHEFLTILMDWLHNDLQTPTRQQIHLESLPAAEKAWLEYTKSKESLILKLFYGQMKSTLTCLTCGNKSITHDSFSNLSLELPAHANKCTLNDCLQLYLQDEKISDWNCPSCKYKRDAVKKLDISKLPPILVIHFKRFYLDPKDYMANSYKKKLTNIDFPLFNLNMGQYSTESYSIKDSMYNLYGVSNHYGSMEGGHYTAYCKSSVYSKWYKFDDHVVTEIPASDVKSSAAYILFYSSLPEN